MDLQWTMLVYCTAIWTILRPFGIFCGILEYFMVIWYILWQFGIFYGHFGMFFPVLLCCTQKNLATPGSTFECMRRGDISPTAE
jgi:hypothetical protein